MQFQKPLNMEKKVLKWARPLELALACARLEVIRLEI